MQVLCIASKDDRADTTCPVCNQNYAVYFSRQDQPERAHALELVRATLITHHEQDKTSAAHPTDIFNVPPWSGAAHMSGAALLSGAPVQATAHAGSIQERLVS